MAGIYKYGYPADTDREEAKAETLRAIRANGDTDPVLDEPSIIETDEHKAAGEYLVRIRTGQPEPETPPDPQPAQAPVEQLAAEREQLLARLAELDAQLDVPPAR